MNTFGTILKLTTFGESHGRGLGCVIDGVPSNLEVNLEDLKTWMERRAPGRLPFTTSRFEDDDVELYSGIYQGKTTGTPIMALIENKNQRSEDYNWAQSEYRPGHADKTYAEKYAHRDPRGGGRASGRETAARVIGGYFASLILPQLKITSAITQLGSEKFPSKELTPSSLMGLNTQDEQPWINKLIALKEEGNSLGGVITVKIENTPKNLGAPIFDKLKADLAKAMLSIGACVGFTWGNDESLYTTTGSELSSNRKNFHGLEGGITNGDDLCFQVMFKAPSTVGKKALEGRHDPCILPRVRVVVESMAYLVLADHFLRNKTIK